MNRKILKISSWMLTILGFGVVLALIYLLIQVIISTNSPYSTILGKVLGVIIGIFLIICGSVGLAPIFLFTGIGSLYYIKGKTSYKLCKIYNIIGIIMFAIPTVWNFIYYILYIKEFGSFTNTYGIMFAIFYFILFVFVINMVGLHNEKNNLTYRILLYRYRFIAIGTIVVIFIISLISICNNLIKYNIINTNKIEITEYNKYALPDFMTQLENRDLMQKYYNYSYNIEANDSEKTCKLDLNSNSKGYSTLVPQPNIYNTTIDEKFPSFKYDAYISLITKNNNTKNNNTKNNNTKNNNTKGYYSLGDGDIYIIWYIYYVDGKTYAAIYKIHKPSEVIYSSELRENKYNIVVSEENDITIYNSVKNYYVKGGGLLTYDRTTDIYNKKCMEIRKVDRVDAKTLDAISKELLTEE